MRLNLGCFHRDSKSGLPEYHYTGPCPVPMNQEIACPNVPFFLLGNHRLTLFPQVDGQLRWLIGERSWMELCRPIESLHGELLVDGKSFSLTGLNSLCSAAEKRFGVGYAEWESELSGLRLERSIHVSPPRGCGEADPAFLLRCRISNTGQSATSVRYVELLEVDPCMVGHRGQTKSQRKVHYLPQVESLPSGLNVTYAASVNDAHFIRARDQAAPIDGYPPNLFVRCNSSGEVLVVLENGALEVASKLEIAPGLSVQVDIAIGAAYPSDDVDSIAERLLLQAEEESRPFLPGWREVIPGFERERDPQLQLELQWHQYTLEAMATRHEFSGETYIPQGTAYDYGLGTNAAPRDHLQHLLGVLHTNPHLAKSSLRFVMNKMQLNGEIMYTEIDAGHLTNMMWHTSDQSLYLFRAVACYLEHTRDRGFLLEECPYAPYGSGLSGSVLEHLEKAFSFLRDEVGLGLAGLPKILNSDWNDAIFYDRPIREHFFIASSHSNAGMAVVALQAFVKVMDQLDGWHGKVSWRESMNSYVRSVEGSWIEDLGDRDFSRRAYLGGGQTLGEDVVYFEPQPWLLQTDKLSAEHKLRVIHLIDRALGEPTGHPYRQLAQALPHDSVFMPGEGENAACWYALSGEWIAALAAVDAGLARKHWERLSMRDYAAAFPDQWIGQWSGPDTLNSSLSAHPGWVNRKFSDLAAFPVFCAHLHAWASYTWHQIHGEAT